MAHASSFNRWAIIEQDLSTSLDAGTGEFLRKAIFYHPQIYHRLVKTIKIGFLFLTLRHFGTQTTVVEGEVYFDTNQLVLFLFGTASHCKIGYDETSIDLGSRLEKGDLDWCANGQVASGMCYSTFPWKLVWKFVESMSSLQYLDRTFSEASALETEDFPPTSMGPLARRVFPIFICYHFVTIYYQFLQNSYFSIDEVGG